MEFLPQKRVFILWRKVSLIGGFKVLFLAIQKEDQKCLSNSMGDILTKCSCMVGFPRMRRALTTVSKV